MKKYLIIVFNIGILFLITGCSSSIPTQVTNCMKSIETDYQAYECKKASTDKLTGYNCNLNESLATKKEHLTNQYLVTEKDNKYTLYAVYKDAKGQDQFMPMATDCGK